MRGGGRSASIALIGYGAIADEIVSGLEARNELGCLRGVLGRPERLPQLGAKSGGRFPIVTDLAGLLALDVDVVIEVAGHEAARRYAPDLLACGRAVLLSSVGVLADRAFASCVIASAAPTAEILVAPGAVAGIDGLRAARGAGLRTVSYTSWKPPAAWRGTPGEVLAARLGAKAGVFFVGTARQAAVDYPRNANVAATIGLLGLGLDRTVVRLGSDPDLAGPRGLIEAEGDFGAFRFEIDTRPSSNPKTSAITAHSLVAAVQDGTAVNARDDVLASIA